MKAIKSTDPRKKKIINYLKITYNIGRVTNVKERPNGDFEGNCFKSLGHRNYEAVGIKICPKGSI